MSPGDLQLEAVKLLQEWSIWLIGICTALITAGTFLSTTAKFSVTTSEVKLACWSLGGTIFCAVLLTGALPAIVQQIDLKTIPKTHYLFGTAPGVYSYRYLGFIPLWVLVALQRVSFLVAITVILRSLQRSLRGNGR